MAPLSFYIAAKVLLVNKSITFTSGVTVLPFSLLLSFISSFFSLFLFLPFLLSFLPKEKDQELMSYEIWNEANTHTNQYSKHLA